MKTRTQRFRHRSHASGYHRSNYEGRSRPLGARSKKNRRHVDLGSPVRRTCGGPRCWADGAMVGFITERELKRAEEAFPGIVRFLESLSEMPRTFLELVVLFEH